ncbi:uncharacterized protein LOC104884395 [Beta vulgaris subsp. vulgaris]|uniref:uncharacterized protein LOC104884395 n=1 Tax=Beta vulgaris subsp. vulgaris TaxID=3555 RepID=UPI0025476BA2|nr:uncharacterized protein LOC104884395 [Beta vulgaris subsp. vulgaris]
METEHGDKPVLKEKLGFVTGDTVKELQDEVKSELWEICNNMVVAWIHNNVSPAIKKSILYVNSAKDIWKQLETRFALTNGSRKYKLNKDLYETKQNNLTVNEYYTALSVIWEESMNLLPTVNNPTEEMGKFIDNINLQKEESRLFQFLNGLDPKYGTHRSQLLMLNPLPTVETACSVLQQEESQREVQRTPKLETEIKRGHSAEKCWYATGNFPKWHPKHGKQVAAGPQKEQGGVSGVKWNTTRQNASKMVANTCQGENGLLFTQQQIEQLAKLLPVMTAQMNAKGTETDDEIDQHFSSMISCFHATDTAEEWIVDSGASDHITSSKLVRDENCEVQFLPEKCVIRDRSSHQVKGVGHERSGLYYLNTAPSAYLTSKKNPELQNNPLNQPKNKPDQFALWHHRSTWIYLLEYKSQPLSTLEAFMSYAKNHFKKSIKFLRSDNALEFSDEPCQEFFTQHGIVHQTSCTAVQVLNNKTPYEALHKKKPTYHHLKVLGCLAFACNPDHHGDKFHPRGVPCVFMGYPPTQKGYKLLNLVTKLMFISRDVLFHEDIFPFQDDASQSYMNPIPNPKPNNSQPVFDDNWFMEDELDQPSDTTTLTSPSHQPPLTTTPSYTSPNSS